MEEGLTESQPEPQVYVIINSEAICENKILWDGVTEWSPPPDTIVVLESEVGLTLDVGNIVAEEIQVSD